MCHQFHANNRTLYTHSILVGCVASYSQQDLIYSPSTDSTDSFVRGTTCINVGHYIQTYFHRAMSQYLSRPPLITEARVSSQVRPHTIYGVQNRTGTDSDPRSTSGFPCQHHSTQCSMLIFIYMLMKSEFLCMYYVCMYVCIYVYIL